MKKILLLLTLCLAMVAITVTPVLGAPGSGQGAIKTELYADYNTATPVVVGSVILNTSASGELIVVVNMDAVADLEGYQVVVSRRAMPCYPKQNYFFPGVLDTNSQGQGNAIVKVTAAELGTFGDATAIPVVVVVTGAGGPWETQDGPPVMVPLK